MRRIIGRSQAEVGTMTAGYDPRRPVAAHQRWRSPKTESAGARSSVSRSTPSTASTPTASSTFRSQGGTDTRLN